MRDAALTILMENAMDFKERHIVMEMSSEQTHLVKSKIVTNMFQSVLQRSDMKYEDLDDSRGDIRNYVDYDVLNNSLSQLGILSEEHNVHIPELKEVQQALDNLYLMSSDFKKGYILDRGMVKLAYRAAAGSVIAATSLLISEYMDFTLDENQTFTFNRRNNASSTMLMGQIRDFNKKAPEIKETLSKINRTDPKQFIGTSTASFFIPVFIIGGVLSIIPLIREMIFLFYHSRLKLSQYAEQQAAFLELNRAVIESSNRTVSEKKKIMSKQRNVITKLNKLSEAVRVNEKLAEKDVVVNMKKENSKWTVDEVTKEVTDEIMSPSTMQATVL